VISGCDDDETAPPEPAPKKAGLPLPAGFNDELVVADWDQPVGITFAENGRMFVWEKAGRLWEVVNGVRAGTPLLDISEEVGNYGDHGMLGVALHPNFLSNGFVYVLYVVDYHHLKFFGTGSYNPNTNQYFTDTIVRLTRYTARSSDNFTSVNYSSRFILFGSSVSNGCPVLSETHGAGSLVFGEDGTLLVTCGEGAGYTNIDVGAGFPPASSGTALDDGILTTKTHVGAFRSQLVDTISGKILRLDPLTGNGIPSNPFYDASAPASARSRVWGLGLRNPYRMTLRPETGSHDPAAADPGTLYLGDVGWETWEELDVVQGPGQNMGWPLYEGFTASPDYPAADIENLDAPNPLNGTTPSGQPLCTKPFFFFRDLLVQDSLNPPSWPNSCAPSQQIPSTLRRFVHHRPVLDWRHNSDQTRRGAYDGSGNATTLAANAPPSPVSTTLFRGGASVGGVWYTGTDFPAEYQNTYFHGDYVGRWIKNFVFDDSDNLITVRDFVPANSADIVAIATDPVNGGLYYINYQLEVHRITYGANGQAPIVAAQANPMNGPSPLLVSFTTNGTSDPEGGALTYSWNWDDGSPNGTGPSPTHSFSGVGAKAFDVMLTVTDPQANARSTTLRISVNNTPPSATITSPLNGNVYSVSSSSSIPLTATLSDAEQSVGALTCEWQSTLHHNTHVHPGPNINTCSTTASVSPLGCGDETYYYSFRLRVSDGFAAPVERTSTLYPDCTPDPFSPTGPQTTNPPTFSWKPVLGADRYQLFVDDSTMSGKINEEYTPLQAGCADGISNCSVSPGTTIAPGSAQFRVRAHNPVAGWRAYSTPLAFSYSGIGQPTLIAPSGTGVSTTPTYSFNSAGGATDYQLWVNDISGSGVINTTYAASTLGCGSGGVCTVTPSKVLAVGPATWWVRGKAGSSFGAWSLAKTFTVSSGAPPPKPTVAPTLSAPTGTTSDTTPTYQFSVVPTATHYELWVDTQGGSNVIDKLYTAAQAGCGSTTCSFAPSTTLPVASFKWWVRGHNAGGDGPWSAKGTFTVSGTGGAPASPPTLNSPSGTIGTATPSFQFTTVPLATSYALWVEGPAHLVQINAVYTSAQAGCGASTCSVAPGTTLVSGASRWWVKAQNSAGNSGWSMGKDFTVP